MSMSTLPGPYPNTPAPPPAPAPARAPAPALALLRRQVSGSTSSGTWRKSGPKASYRRLVAGSDSTE
jgi:hypothetical protein